MPAPRHIFQTFIRATPEAIWQAITDPDFTRRYFHRTAIDGAFDARLARALPAPRRARAVVGEIEEVDPPHLLVMTWRVMYDPAAGGGAAEPGRVAAHAGRRRRHAGDDDPPRPGPQPGDLGERGCRLAVDPRLDEVAARDRRAARRLADRAGAVAAARRRRRSRLHRRTGVEANNATWELLGRWSELTADDADDLLGRAYAAAYHWQRACRRGPGQRCAGLVAVSRAHAVLGQGELALHHADRCVAVATEAGLADFDLAYAHEARARALACLGRLDEAAAELAAACAVPIADDEDRTIVDETSPKAPGTAWMIRVFRRIRVFRPGIHDGALGWTRLGTVAP